MKITSADFEALRAAVAPLDTQATRERYARRDFPRADAVKNLELRYRWDLLHASRFDTCNLYRYLDDSHIDTALRAIVEPLQQVAP